MKAQNLRRIGKIRRREALRENFEIVIFKFEIVHETQTHKLI